MIKKIIIFGLVGWGLWYFYQTFVAPEVEPFFRNKAGQVDFVGTSTTGDNVRPSE